MSTSFQTFELLHKNPSMFLLPNAWDARSAALFQECNYPAVGTSSAAVAEGLGYEDGEQMPFSDYLVVVRRITASVNIPVTIDLEMGYGKTNEEIFSNIQKLLDLGVVGINLEDSTIENGDRRLVNENEFAKKVEFLQTRLATTRQSFFINVRCDTFMLNVPNKSEETSRRIKIYESAGANGLFLPLISQEQDIARVISETKLPLNVMCIPGLQDMATLDQLGVRRLSMGPFLHRKAYAYVHDLARNVIEQKSLQPIL